MARISDAELKRLRSYESQATAGPWIFQGNTLHLGKQELGVKTLEIEKTEDAILIAVMRSWFVDLLDEIERLRPCE